MLRMEIKEFIFSQSGKVHNQFFQSFCCIGLQMAAANAHHRCCAVNLRSKQSRFYLYLRYCPVTNWNRFDSQWCQHIAGSQKLHKVQIRLVPPIYVKFFDSAPLLRHLELVNYVTREYCPFGTM